MASFPAILRCIDDFDELSFTNWAVWRHMYVKDFVQFREYKGKLLGKDVEKAFSEKSTRSRNS